MEQLETGKPQPALRRFPDQASIRPFRFEASESDLIDLRRRIEATRWPLTICVPGGAEMTKCVGRAGVTGAAVVRLPST